MWDQTANAAANEHGSSYRYLILVPTFVFHVQIGYLNTCGAPLELDSDPQLVQTLFSSSHMEEITGWIGANSNVVSAIIGAVIGAVLQPAVTEIFRWFRNRDDKQRSRPSL